MMEGRTWDSLVERILEKILEEKFRGSMGLNSAKEECDFYFGMRDMK